MNLTRFHGCKGFDIVPLKPIICDMMEARRLLCDFFQSVSKIKQQSVSKIKLTTSDGERT